MQSAKTYSLNYIELTHHLLTFQKLGIPQTQITIQLPLYLIPQIQQSLQTSTTQQPSINTSTFIPTPSPSSLNYGKYLKQITKSSPRQIIGMLKFHKPTLLQIQSKHKVKIVLSNNGIKIFSHDESNLYSAEIDFFQRLGSKVRSYQIDKYGKELYLCKSVEKKLKEIKVINYQNDKYCYYFHIDEIDEDIAEARILDVQHQYYREYLTYIGARPKGTLVRRALKMVLELKIRKMIMEKEDKNTEVSERGDGFILQQKDRYSLDMIKNDYTTELRNQNLNFICFVKHVENIEKKLTKLSKVSKYLLVSFTQLIDQSGKEPLRLISMMIRTKELYSILRQTRQPNFRKTFGNILKQIHQLNSECNFSIGFWFPFENQYRIELEKAFEAELEKNFKITYPNNKLEGIIMVIPKITEENPENGYLKVMDAAVRRKIKLGKLTEVQANQLNGTEKEEVSVNRGDMGMNQDSFNTTIIRDESIINQWNENNLLNNTLLNNTALKESLVPEQFSNYSLNLNLQPSPFEPLPTLFKRGLKDNDVQKLIQDHTNQFYKVWKISLQESSEKFPHGEDFKQKPQVTCMLKVVDLEKEGGVMYFQKIKSGKRIEKGILVQVVVDSNVMEEKEDGFKVKEGMKAEYLLTHEVQLI